MSSTISNALIEQAGAHFQAGRLAEAERLFAAVLAEDPAHAGANRMLGFMLFQQGRTADALPLLARALERHADPATLVNYGLALAASGRAADALASFDKAAEAAPDNFVIHYNRGHMLRHLGRAEEALTAYARAAQLNPHLGEIHGSRGETLNALGRFAEALVVFDRALALKPKEAWLHGGRGIALNQLGRLEEALAAYETALQQDPAYADAFYNRGVALAQAGRTGEALAAFDQALVLKPDMTEALFNRAGIHRQLRQRRQAAEDYRRLIALNPGHVEAHANLGMVQQEAGRFEEALVTFQALEKISPAHPHVFGNLVASAALVCDWRMLARLEPGIDAHIRAGRPALPVFSLMGLRDDPALFLQAAKNIVAQRMPELPQERLFQGPPWGHERIRIAYLSADFRNHATSVLITELIEKHDRSRFEVIGIATAPTDDTALGARIARAFDRFLPMAGASYLDIAREVRRLEADIAIDLNGHTRDCFVDVLAHRPAPVQVNYLGFPGSIGADFADYILADAVVLPLAEQDTISERIVHLPDCYQPNDTRRAIAPETPSRAELGLPATGFVFACFNHSWKITPPVFDIWMRLLEKVPGSVLWLLETLPEAVNNLRGEAARRGIAPERLVFAPRDPLEKHLARHRLADLFIDTMPYNAHTTASDALWAGLPVVTWKGRSFPSRVGASLLTAMGLDELITHSAAEYEELALALARDPSRLSALRRKLAANRGHCALFDIDRYRRGIEAAFVQMWETAERGGAPQAFAVRDLPGWRDE